MNALRAEHKQVLKTMHIAGIISRQTMRSIYGQLFDMSDSEREGYLKKVIRNCIKKLNYNERTNK